MESNDKKNPLIQGDHSSIAVKDLHNNVDNHTDSHDIHHHATNNNTVNQNSTVIYNGVAATEKLLSERREEYRRFCEKNIITPIINRQTRLELNEMISRLQLEQTIAEDIENTVREKLSTTGTLSKNDRITLSIAIDALHNDSGKELLNKLTALADKSEDEEVQFYANLALSVYDSRKCIQRYECKKFDSYWQTFWTYFAYKHNGNNQKAERILTHLTAWTDYPEDQITLLSGAGCLYDYFAANGSESLRQTAVGFLKGCTSYSSLLSDFFSVLAQLINKKRPLYYGNNPVQNLYFRLFGAKEFSKSADMYDIINNTNTVSTPSRPHNSCNISDTKTNSKTGSTEQRSRIPYIIGGLIVTIALFLWLRPGDENKKLTEANEDVAEVIKDVQIANVTEQPSISELKDHPKQTKSGDIPTSVQKVKEEKEQKNTINPNTANVLDRQQITDQTPTVEKQPSNEPAKKIEEIDVPPVKKESELEKQINLLASGNITAATKLGKMYLDGNGVNKNNKQAFAYFKQAAEAGNLDGMYWLGWCYRYGRGTKKDLNQAKTWWTKAAASGHPIAAEDVKEFNTLM